MQTLVQIHSDWKEQNSSQGNIRGKLAETLEKLEERKENQQD